MAKSQYSFATDQSVDSPEKLKKYTQNGAPGIPTNNFLNTTDSGTVIGNGNTAKTGFPHSNEQKSELVQIQETKKLKSESIIPTSNLEDQP